MEKDQRSQAAALLGTYRVKETKPCAVCGTAFTALRFGRYCGNTCKVRAYRKRRKAKENRAMQVTKPPSPYF